MAQLYPLQLFFPAPAGVLYHGLLLILIASALGRNLTSDGLPISEADVIAYTEHGHAITRGLLDDALVDETIPTKIRKLLLEHGRNAFGDGNDGAASKEVRFTFAVHELDDDVSTFLRNQDGALWQAARRLTGADKLCVLMDRGFSKDRGDPETHWHRDDEAVGLHTAFPGTRTIHAWIPLTPMTKDMGTLQFLRGTHKYARSHFEQLLSSVWGQEFAWWALAEKLQDDNFILGDVSWHDGWLLHAAGTNAGAGGVRDGYAVSFAYCAAGDCNGGALKDSVDGITCKAAASLFDPVWLENHRKGSSDYAKTAITDSLGVQGARFLWRSIMGALLGLGVQMFFNLTARCCRRRRQLKAE